jgi:hypothetical protein
MDGESPHNRGQPVQNQVVAATDANVQWSLLNLPTHPCSFAYYLASVCLCTECDQSGRYVSSSPSRESKKPPFQAAWWSFEGAN